MGALSDEVATDLLSRASDDARSYCRWSISEKSYVLDLDSVGDAVLLLPAMRVSAVTLVSVAGVTLVDGTDYEWASSGVLTGCWPRGRRSVHVEFTAGYNPVPRDVVGAVCSLAARTAALRGGFTQQRIGSLSLGQSLTSGAGLGHFETDVLDRYKLP